MGNKLGKLLTIDVVTSAAICGRYARLCVQFIIAYPLPKRVKIGAFWQDIVYENLPVLCFRCGRLGHREVTCSKTSPAMTHTHIPELEPHGKTGVPKLERTHTPWKTVQTRRSGMRGKPGENFPRGKLPHRDVHTPNNPRAPTPSTDPVVLRTNPAHSVIGQVSKGHP